MGQNIKTLLNNIIQIQIICGNCLRLKQRSPRFRHLVNEANRLQCKNFLSCMCFRVSLSNFGSSDVSAVTGSVIRYIHTYCPNNSVVSKPENTGFKKGSNAQGHLLLGKCIPAERSPAFATLLSQLYGLTQCFSTAGLRPGTGPWHQLYQTARSSPGICHLSFLNIFHE